jgi:hypothetical protein
MGRLPVTTDTECQIHARLSELLERYDEVRTFIQEALDEQDHEALGYPSWTAYVAGEFGDVLAKLQRSERRSVFAMPAGWITDLTGERA